jgi:hypothetical protein
MADFKKLKVWQKAHALSLQVDRDCRQIRSAHYASLRSQMFRAAMSIPANIAEGRRQTSDKQFGRFLGYAMRRLSIPEPDSTAKNSTPPKTPKDSARPKKSGGPKKSAASQESAAPQESASP